MLVPSVARLGPLLISLWLALSVATARAEPQPTDAVLYEASLSEAIQAHGSGRFEEAYALFQEAHALYPSARTLRGMGVAAFEAGRVSQAIVELEAALVHPERALSPELRDAVSALVSRARQGVASYRVTLAPEQSTLYVDGVSALLGADGELLLDPGAHALRGEAPGHQTQRLDVVATAGAKEHMEISLARERLVREAPAPPTVSPGSEATPLALANSAVVLQPAPATRPGDASEGWRSFRRPTFLVTAAVGVAAFATAVALVPVGNRRVTDVSTYCSAKEAGGCTSREANERYQAVHLRRLELSIDAALVVGIASVAALAVLWLKDRGSRRLRTAFTPASLGVAF